MSAPGIRAAHPFIVDGATDLYLNGQGDGLAVSTEAFWGATPALGALRQAAMARLVSPWAMLGVTLARIIAATPHRVVLPPLIGDYGSLNLFVALVGASGDGKGGATTAAANAMHLGRGAHGFAVHKLGSGQGLAHAYATRDKQGNLQRHTESVLFVAEEIDTVAGNARMTGSILLSELRSLYMAERLGAMYVDPAKRVEVESHSYRASVILHVQPGRAGPLLDDVDGGTPQRFIWLPTQYPHPESEPGLPPRLDWSAPYWVEDNPRVDNRTTMPIPEAAAELIRTSRRARARGEGDPLDGHRLFAREKVAAALAILDGRPAVTERDWALSATVMAVSDATRELVLSTLAEAKRQMGRERASAAAMQAVAADEALTERAIERVTKRVKQFIPPAPQWTTRKHLRDRCVASRDRAYLDDALIALKRAGWITTVRAGQVTRYQRADDA